MHAIAIAPLTKTNLAMREFGDMFHVGLSLHRQARVLVTRCHAQYRYQVKQLPPFSSYAADSITGSSGRPMAKPRSEASETDFEDSKGASIQIIYIALRRS